MKSIDKSINIEYWVYPDGKDFEGIEEFISEVDKDYFLGVNKYRTDALGGGLYDLIIEISEELSVFELSKSYIVDGIQVYLAYHAKSLFKSLTTLFQKNEQLKPSIEKVVVNFKDCKLVLHEVYSNGIEENFEEIVNTLFEFCNSNKKRFKKIKSIHIPIVNHRDTYDLCDYRVKLDVDENKFDYNADDYLKFWGLKFKNKDLVLNVKKGKILKEKFYTQKGYDKLYREKYL